LSPRRLAFALLLLVLVLPAVALRPGTAAARTRLDARVDALPAAQLLSATAPALVDARRQRRARAIADLRDAATAGWGLAQILAFWWFWRSGIGARVRDAVRRRRRGRLPQRVAFGAAIGALGPVAALPFALASYRIEFSGGVTGERLSQWFLDYALRIFLDALLGAVVVATVLALVDKVRTWYLIVAGGIFAGAVLAAALIPSLPVGPAHKTTPRAVAALQAREALAAGAPGTPVVVLATSRRSNAMTVDAVGIGPTAHAVLGDTTLDHLTDPELRFALAQADAHVARGDALRRTLAGVLLFIVSATIAVLLSDRVGFRRDDDALSRLSLVATFLGAVMALSYPLYTAYGRALERGADRSALQATGDRDGAVRALVRIADDDLVALCERRSLRWYFDDRPPLGSRIAALAGTADACAP